MKRKKTDRNDCSAYDALNRRIVACERCPRLIAHCRATAAQPRASYRGQNYHGRPVPNFGDPHARLLIVGLAPGAHGANRTGRMFTGDRSGDFLYRAMHAAGFASQPTSVAAVDGLTLHDAAITAAAHCAPPGNKPLPQELDACTVHLDDTFAALPRLRVVLSLGAIAFNAVLRHGRRRGWITRLSEYRFAHAARFDPDGGPTLLCSYHPSQQNTFTGRLTDDMLRNVFHQAAALLRSAR